MAKIPIKLVEITDESGETGIEVMMSMKDFEETDATLRSTIKKFKEKYLQSISDARKIDTLGASKKRAVSTKKRWKACKILADFNADAQNAFDIVNYKEAYSRDFGVPLRSIRTYIDFGTLFSEDEVLDIIPYSVYAELVFKANGLRHKGLLDSEKEWLLSRARAGKVPDRDEYRNRLKGL